MTHRTRPVAPATFFDRLGAFAAELQAEVVQLDRDVATARARGFHELAKSLAHWRVRLNGIRGRIGQVISDGERDQKGTPGPT